MKALYRKYRPTSLDTVVGQSQVVDPLKNSLKHDKISHAYLFCGPRGTGKTSIARIFAHEINGFKYELEDSYIDIVEIDAASNTGVDNIRELREKAIIAPTEGKYKIYIIDEVHMLSKAAFNALLKIMEEPPAHVVFIMATTNPEKVPVTITSRAQLFTFKLADPKVMFDHLSSVAKQEGIKITDDALKIVVERGGGSFRDSISLLDQISTLSSDKITADLVTSALGLPAAAKIQSLLDDYSSGNLNSATDTLRDLINSGSEAEALATALVEQIVSHPTPATLSLAPKLFEVQDPFAEAKLLVAFLGAGAAPVSVAPASAAPAAAPVAASPAAPKSSPKLDLKTPSAKQSETNSAPAESAAENTAAENTSAGTAAPVASAENTAAASAEPATSTATAAEPAASAATSLSAETFASALHAQNPGLASFLNKGKLVATAQSVDIYPANRVHHNIFMNENNLAVLREVAAGALLTIHEPGEKPAASTSAPENPQTSEISAIMGDIQEVNEDGDDPFGSD